MYLNGLNMWSSRPVISVSYIQRSSPSSLLPSVECHSKISNRSLAHDSTAASTWTTSPLPWCQPTMAESNPFLDNPQERCDLYNLYIECMKTLALIESHSWITKFLTPYDRHVSMLYTLKYISFLNISDSSSWNGLIKLIFWQFGSRGFCPTSALYQP
ncbi:hypothetical protein BT96DRAFT_990911 [Gymnopus androsaceus JB14]|uniref:Uncharacterized protein n=1 Tax=Gymnopus androsaceus JB14 TaxID=1447944 RepID=A0A6A4HZQ6_9AGAR|nr:hypothetical protein BT96DRAFT_990911 [Gymnopus androsaceus JB14]